MMNPIELSRTPADTAHYRGEPYVVAADISFAAGRVGQCGWTWYTGSAGWMYRTWIEGVLGLRVCGDSLRIDPVIPDDWPGFELTFRHGGTVYEVKVIRQESFISGAVARDREPIPVEVRSPVIPSSRQRRAGPKDEPAVLVSG